MRSVDSNENEVLLCSRLVPIEDSVRLVDLLDHRSGKDESSYPRATRPSVGTDSHLRDEMMDEDLFNLVYLADCSLSDSLAQLVYV